MARIEMTGKVKLGYRKDSFPFSFVGKDGPAGYSIDICEAIVKAIRTLYHKDIARDFVEVTTATRLSKIVNREIDLECGSTTDNYVSEQSVDFSPTIFFTGTAVMVPAKSVLSRFEDLNGRTVVVMSNTTNVRRLRTLAEEYHLAINFTEVDNRDEGYRLLENGKADAFAADDVLLRGVIASHVGANKRFKVVYDLSRSGRYLSHEGYGIPFHRHEPDLCAVVEGAVRELVDSRKIETIYNKWFGPKGEGLDIEMDLEHNYALKDQFTKLAAKYLCK
jgi:glutamate/aspartate transport system substrate-binding protein